MTTGVLNHKITRRGFLKTSAALGAVAALGDRLFGGPLSTLMVGAQVEGVVSDKWVTSVCWLCRGGRDAIKGHVVNGVLVSVEGNNALEGKFLTPSMCCVKPRGFPTSVYNPYRVKGPMKRTNPMKGLDEDPGFVEISWDEALDILAGKLKEIQNSPQGFKNELGHNRVNTGTMCCGKSIPTWGNFWSTFGPTEGASSWPNNCYGTEHYFAINWTYQYAEAGDSEYTNWFLAIGKNKIGATTMGYGVSGIKELADYAVRGGKLIYLSPYMGQTGAKADEWIPIKMTTDAALLYAMVNVILEELDWRQVADVDFIKKVTSSPYLVGPEGYWARDPETNKILVWDSVDNVAKVHDDPTIKDFALEGGPYSVNAYELGVDDVSTTVSQATPSFQLLIEHMKTNTPEWAAAITDVPAKTIRRLASEFVEHSMVGSTINIDGYTYRYRPATMHLGKHVTSGLGSYSNGWAVGLLFMLMGSLHAPGGMTVPGVVYASENKANPGSWISLGAEMAWTKEQQVDGFFPRSNPYGSGNFSYPPTSRNPSFLGLKGTQASFKNEAIYGNAVHDIPGDIPDLLFTIGHNKVAGHGDADRTRRGLAQIPFYAALAYNFNESNWFADLLLPDALWIAEDLAYLSASSSPQVMTSSRTNYFGPNQPMVKSPVNARDASDIFTDLAAKMGPEFLEEYNQKALGSAFEGDLTKKYTVEEIVDSKIKRGSNGMPPELRGKGLDWYRANGGVITWPVTPVQLNYYREMEKNETRYDLPYQEGYKRASLKRLELLHEVGVNWRDESFDVLTHGMIPYEDARTKYEEVYGADAEYDLWQAHHRVHQFGHQRNKDMTWNIESMDPESEGIVMNPETAAKKGLKNGDWVALEDRFGGKTTGRLIVSPTVHPEAVETPDYGHYQTPISRTVGQPSSAEIETFNSRLVSPFGEIRCSGAVVKVYKTAEIIPNKPAQI